MEKREHLGSRLGFILLSAGCAIGCGNVWKFPWMTGQFGGGGFVLVYIICLLVLGLPVMVMEFALGRASQKSPLGMYQPLEKKGSKWHVHGWFALLGNVALMAFYTVVTGWMIYYFWMFLTGKNEGLGFVGMITNPGVNVIFLAIAVVVGFAILSFNLQGGLERVTKYLMIALLVLMLVLAIRSCTLPNAGEGLKFYLVPDFSKITGKRHHSGHLRRDRGRPHHLPRLHQLRRGGRRRSRAAVQHDGDGLQQYDGRTHLGRSVLPVHGVRGPEHGAGCV